MPGWMDFNGPVTESINRNTFPHAGKLHLGSAAIAGLGRPWLLFHWDGMIRVSRISVTPVLSVGGPPYPYQSCGEAARLLAWRWRLE